MTTRLVSMEAVQESMVTLAEAARLLGTPLEALLQQIYDGVLPAAPERSSGRLLVSVVEVERLRARLGA